jgi:mannose-1-phosphate guanylyltransferase
MPSVYDKLMAISAQLGTPEADQFIHGIWPSVEKQTIDYGIMENAGEEVVLPARDLQWEDVGSWDSMFDLLESDENSNIVRNCRDVLIDSKNLLVFGDDPEKLVAAIGIEDLIVVNWKNSLLICRKGDSQRVKDIIDQLKKNDMGSYL